MDIATNILPDPLDRFANAVPNAEIARREALSIVQSVRAWTDDERAEFTRLTDSIVISEAERIDL